MSKDYQEAARRIANTPELAQYRDILLEYDWDNQGEHYQWIINASVSEIIDWAESIRRGEEELRQLADDTEMDDYPETEQEANHL